MEQYIAYINGYKPSFRKSRVISGKKYIFIKNSLTKMNNKEDYEYFLNLTSEDIEWSKSISEELKPFCSLEEFYEKYGEGKDIEEFINEKSVGNAARQIRENNRKRLSTFCCGGKK